MPNTIVPRSEAAIGDEIKWKPRTNIGSSSGIIDSFLDDGRIRVRYQIDEFQDRAVNVDPKRVISVSRPSAKLWDALIAEVVSVSYAKNVPVVNLNWEPEILLEFLKAQEAVDMALIQSRRFPKSGWMEMWEGWNYLINELTNLTKISKILTVPAENVPLYCFQSTRMRPANGKAILIVEGVNSRSLGVIRENSDTSIMDLTKTPSIIPVTTFINYATTVTIFGTLRMTRLTIPITLTTNSMNLEKQNSLNLSADMVASTKQNREML